MYIFATDVIVVGVGTLSRSLGSNLLGIFSGGLPLPM